MIIFKIFVTMKVFMNILVTGGAGYIGSVTVKRLLAQGNQVVVFDNLEQGHKETVSCRVVKGDLLDPLSFDPLKTEKFDGVVHFAALALAGESMKQPERYFRVNIQGGLNLLEFMHAQNIPSIIFSSSCAIYGTPIKVPVSETESKKPESVYGESKLAFEKVLYWYDQIYHIKHINLRYFNACGAALDGSSGEAHHPETHIIPLAIQAAMNNTPFSLFGNDYPTSDGTCVRDYIHVEDLAQAHSLALKKITETKKSDSFNLGTGHGYSNLQILNAVKRISGVDFPIEILPRRFGDPANIYADNTKAVKELGFHPEYSDIDTIVKTAWEWQKNHPVTS